MEKEMDFETITDAKTWYDNSGFANWDWFDGFEETDLVEFAFRSGHKFYNGNELVSAFLIDHGENPGDYGLANPHAVALGRLGGQAKSEAKTEAARKNAKRPRPRTDYDRVLTLGYPKGLQKEGDECPSCGEKSMWLECVNCGRGGYIIDCGHYAQPRPIADGVCADCVS